MAVYENSTMKVEEVFLGGEPAVNAWIPNTPGGISDYGALPGAPTLADTPDLAIGDIWNGYTLILKDPNGDPNDTDNWGWELGDSPQDTLEGAPPDPNVGDTFLDYTYGETVPGTVNRAFYGVKKKSDDTLVARYDVYKAADKVPQLAAATGRADWWEANPDGGVAPVQPEPPADIFA